MDNGLVEVTDKCCKKKEYCALCYEGFWQSVPPETIVHIIEDTFASRTFSRHGITRASSVLLIWLNENVRFHQKDTLKRFFERFEQNRLTVNRFRADCGSCSEEIVEEIEKHCKSFYIRANRCSSLYNDIFALRGWKTEEINGIEFELNSILVEKWKGKAYRLVIQRQKRMDGMQDLWEGEYTYRCILTNDYESSAREIVEFYNFRGGKEGFR